MTKSTSYRETFRRHRLLLSLPIVLAVFVAVWFVLGSPKAYQSTASLWVDTPASTDSSLGNANPALLPPSQQEQNVVTELLTTRDFVLAVGHHSILAQYLASHPSSGFSPTALLSRLSGGGSVDDQIIAALGPNAVTTAVPGPQVLQISWNGVTPAVAASTLGAIVSELQSKSAQFGQAHSEGALAYARAQVQAASSAVDSARNQVNAYLSQHRGAGGGDPNLTALQTAEGVASAQLTQANTSYTAAESALKGPAAGSDVQVIDPPSVPTAPVSGKKKELVAILGGLFAGALISFLGAVALTARESKSLEDEEELARQSAAFDAALPYGVVAETPSNGVVAETAATNGATGPVTGKRLVYRRQLAGDEREVSDRT